MHALAIACVAVLLASCSWIEKELETKTKLKAVQVVAQDGMNEDNATALDLVFAYDDAAAGLLPKTAPLWFASKSSLLANLGPSLDVVELQMVPNLAVASVPLPRHHAKAVAVVSYANYQAPAAQAMGQLTKYTCVKLSLAPAEVQYLTCDR